MILHMLKQTFGMLKKKKMWLWATYIDIVYEGGRL
jgi:hypothetical protein